ncbi:exocyst complex component 3-like protein isoform X2 [Pelodiscus sinensis]|uniref:exocyst complex component 3-like protein isoform X2 n=1 Tax=Pelodiscus sinensis TaxID=13735 RepID=UPI003F6BBC2C
MGLAAEREEDASSPREEGWPEAEKAEKLARGAAVKWASGVFYRPDKLEGLGHYRSREAQRNSSIQSRLKSTVQSHLEGVSAGLEQLRSAAGDVRSLRRDLGAVWWQLRGSAGAFRSLEPLRAVAAEHAQLAAVVQALPQLSSVRDLLAQSLQLLHDQQLLEAHAGLMALERLRDKTYAQLGGGDGPLGEPAVAAVESLFRGLPELSEALAQQLWCTVGRGVELVQEDPARFVAAVRIVEREEGLDGAPRAHRFLPPGRPRAWRQRFYQVLEETVAANHFQADPVDPKGPGLGRHLAVLQRDILAELRVVKDLMAQCCPPHYDIVGVCTRLYHRALCAQLQGVAGRDLDKQELFLLLVWVLHVYPGPEMMGHPDLLPEVQVAALGPLLPAEVLDQMERAYVGKVKMLGENIRVASLVTESLQQKVHAMALGELEAFLLRLREALGECGKEHQRDPARPQHYVSYLLAVLNNTLALSSSIPTLHPGGASPAEPAGIPPSLTAALDRTQKKACRLLLEELLAELQPLYVQLPSRKWLAGDQLVTSMCGVIDKYMSDISHAQKPIFSVLLAESEHLVMSHYVRALLEKKMVCRSAEERSQLSARLLQDASQLRELFHNLGLAESEQSLEVICALQELIRLQDPALLSLEVLGFVTKYPDVSDEHISIVLELRGDVSKEARNVVLEMMAQNPQTLPENYRPIFSSILVPAPDLPFCLGKSKCA